MDSGIPAPWGVPQPWKIVARPGTDVRYLALLTYFHLNSLGKLIPFLRMSARVSRQIEATPGAIGYAMLANPVKRRFWTLSAWEDPDNEETLRDFVRAIPHREAMRAFGATSGVEFKSLRWTIKGSDLPLTWKAAAAEVRKAGSRG